jgi:hypothetical protein
LPPLRRSTKQDAAYKSAAIVVVSCIADGFSLCCGAVLAHERPLTADLTFFDNWDLDEKSAHFMETSEVFIELTAYFIDLTKILRARSQSEQLTARGCGSFRKVMFFSWLSVTRQNS